VQGLSEAQQARVVNPCYDIEISTPFISLERNFILALRLNVRIGWGRSIQFIWRRCTWYPRFAYFNVNADKPLHIWP
jgi:hypothetical protein